MKVKKFFILIFFSVVFLSFLKSIVMVIDGALNDLEIFGGICVFTIFHLIIIFSFSRVFFKEDSKEKDFNF